LGHHNSRQDFAVDPASLREVDRDLEDEVSRRAGELHESLDQLQVSLGGLPDCLSGEEPPVGAEGGSDRYLNIY
jgi:hypothetical protein